MILVRHGQSEFNLHYSQTKIDPGIEDPKLTPLGAAQARSTAEALVGHAPRRILSSPYHRALETAEIIASHLGLPIDIDPIVGERAAFTCDIGSPPSRLAQRWPHLRFDHLTDQWWPTFEESEAALAARCARFYELSHDWDDRDQVLVVTHWGFIRGLTGIAVSNCTAVKVGRLPEPVGIDRLAPGEVVHIPET
ncbi:MAG: histidine phosphatase family protein [Elsteraceae bacterium]